MLNRLRSDIRDIFTGINTILVNKSIFDQDPENYSGAECYWEFSADMLMKELKKSGVKLKFFRRNKKECSFIEQNINNIKHNSHTLHTLENGIESIARGSFIIITCDLSDAELVRKSTFSVASSSSPLEIRMVSSYVSNFNSFKMFEEIGNIVIRSR